MLSFKQSTAMHSAFCGSSRRASLMLGARPCCTNRQRSSTLQVKAVLEPTTAAAVTQQATAFAIVLAAEAAFSRGNVPESDKGRPGIPQVAVGVGGTLVAALLVGQGGSGSGPTLGLVAGFVIAAGMLAYNAQRTLDLQYSDGDWPGPKAWPAGMSLISFFALNVFFQALVQDFTTSVV